MRATWTLRSRGLTKTDYASEEANQEIANVPTKTDTVPAIRIDKNAVNKASGLCTESTAGTDTKRQT